MKYPVLHTESLEVGYKIGKRNIKTILSGLNLNLYQGELVCLLGPNGVGKSTLLRTLSGIQPVINGEIFLNHIPLNKLTKNDLAKIMSLVLTDRIFSGNLTVFDLIALGRHPHTDWSGRLKKTDEEKIIYAIQKTGLENLVEQKIYEISDGQLQKAMIARALAQDGQLMILDEPTAHLDLSNKVEILLLLRSLAQDTKKAILVATHELDLSIKIADKLWISQSHQPVISGIPEELVLSGIINKSFFRKDYKLDLKTGQVKLKLPAKSGIKVKGKGKPFFWTKHALERVGYFIDNAADKQIDIIDNKNNIKWILSYQDKDETYLSLRDLIAELKHSEDNTNS